MRWQNGQGSLEKCASTYNLAKLKNHTYIIPCGLQLKLTLAAEKQQHFYSFHNL